MKLNSQQRVLAHGQLRRLYSSTETDVAFVDESYRLPGSGYGEPFYLMTAVVVNVEELDTLRDGLIDVAGGNYWHTTERYGLGLHGQMAIEDMARVVTAGGGISLVTVHARPQPTDRSLEGARQACFVRLSNVLTRGSADTAVRVIVYEGREDGEHTQRDTSTVKLMKEKNVVPPGTQFFATSPSAEPLLWAPDVASWALRYQLTRDDDRYWSHLAPAAQIVSAPSGRHIDPHTFQRHGALAQIKRDDIGAELTRTAPRPDFSDKSVSEWSR